MTLGTPKYRYKVAPLFLVSVCFFYFFEEPAFQRQVRRVNYNGKVWITAILRDRYLKLENGVYLDHNVPRLKPFGFVFMSAVKAQFF